MNFAPARIEVPSDVCLEYVDFFHHFYALAFNTTLTQRNPDSVSGKAQLKPKPEAPLK